MIQRFPVCGAVIAHRINCFLIIMQLFYNVFIQLVNAGRFLGFRHLRLCLEQPADNLFELWCQYLVCKLTKQNRRRAGFFLNPLAGKNRTQYIEILLVFYEILGQVLMVIFPRVP